MTSAELGEDELLATVLSALDDAASLWREVMGRCDCSGREERCTSCELILDDVTAYEHAYAVLAEGDLQPAGRAVEVVRVRGARL